MQFASFCLAFPSGLNGVFCEVKDNNLGIDELNIIEAHGHVSQICRSP